MLIGLGACKKTINSTPYNAHGVSFSVPEGWKQAESEIPETGMYIMVEKEGEDETGQFIVSVLNNSIPLQTYMDIMKDELFKTLSLSNTQIHFTPVESENYNGVEALTCKFVHDANQLNFRGELKAFHCGEKNSLPFYARRETGCGRK